MIDQFARAVRSEIQKDITNYTGDLARGQPQTFEAYQKLCGMIQGLVRAEQILNDLAKKAIEDDE